MKRYIVIFILSFFSIQTFASPKVIIKLVVTFGNPAKCCKGIGICGFAPGPWDPNGGLNPAGFKPALMEVSENGEVSLHFLIENNAPLDPQLEQESFVIETAYPLNQKTLIAGRFPEGTFIPAGTYPVENLNDRVVIHFGRLSQP